MCSAAPLISTIMPFGTVRRSPVLVAYWGSSEGHVSVRFAMRLSARDYTLAGSHDTQELCLCAHCRSINYPAAHACRVSSLCSNVRGAALLPEEGRVSVRFAMRL